METVNPGYILLRKIYRNLSIFLMASTATFAASTVTATDHVTFSGGMVNKAVMTLQAVEAVSVELSPTFEFDAAEHVANGVALRNRSAGTIHLRGVPVDRKVIKAYLYWNFSDENGVGANRRPVLFNGNNVIGIKTADNADPCWGMSGNHTYRGDVTPFVPLEDPNQDYRVVTRFNINTSTTGQNPWPNIEDQTRRMEGAWLIVVYESEDSTGLPARKTAIYDQLSGATAIGTDLMVFFSHPGIGPDTSGLFTMCGADGQRGPSNTNSNAANEQTFFNGHQIAGPFDPAAPPFPLPLSASDWDGSDGWPLVQLSDTHTHEVRLNDSGTSQVEYKIGTDCVTPVAFVIEGN